MKKEAMMKKLLFFAAVLLFVTGCAGSYYVEDNEKSAEIAWEIEALKERLNQNPDDTAVKSQLAENMFNLELERAKAAGVSKENEQFFINKGSNISVLLVHGFTASPWELRELGEYLADKGYTVYGTLLAGHGTTKEDLRKTKWQDWYNSVENAYEALNLVSDKIFIVGESTGGSLGMVLAEERDSIAGIVCMACPIYLADEKAKFVPLLKYLYPYQLRNLSEEDKQHYYEYRPLESVEQLMDMIDFNKESMGMLNSPILIIQDREDHTVDPKSAEFIYSNIGSSDKKMVYFDGNHHVLTKSKYKQEIFGLVETFIDEHK
jgi:carboxylesterase